MTILKKPKKLQLKIAILSILLLMHNALFAQTIEEVIKLTLKNSPELLQKEAAKNKTENNLQGTMGGYLPQIDLTNAYGKDRNTNNTTRETAGGSLSLTKRESSVALNQMLFDGFSVKSDIEANAARLKSSAHEVYTTIENVVLRAIEAYLEVLRLRVHVKFAKENLASHQNIYQQIQLRTESGIAKKADLDQATGRLALARTNLLEQQATLRDAENNFRRITGFNADVLIRPEVSEEVLPITEDAAVAMALQNHPELQRSMADILAAKAEKKKARAAYYPTLGLQVTGTNNRNVNGVRANTDSFSVMLKFNYNVFRGGKDRAQENAAAWALEESKEGLSQVRRQVEQSMRISWNAYSNARAQLQYRKEHAEAIQKTRDAYKDQFSIGQRTLLDLLDSENELFSANTAYISAQYVELLGKYRVLGSMGKLIRYFKMPIPETAKYTPRKWIDGF